MSGRLQNGCKPDDLIAWARRVRANAVKLRRLAAAHRARIIAQHAPEIDGNHSLPQPDPSAEPSGLPARGVVTIGGSAGAMLSVCDILAALPDAFEPAIVISLHRADGDLVRVFQRRSSRPVRWAFDDESLRAGYTYVAPPHCHVIINPDERLRVSHAPRVRYFRPSVDWLFESAAATFEHRHIAVVLSGRLDDGAAGVRSVTRLGGVAIAEEPASSAFGAMPQAAIQTGCVTTVLPRQRLAAAILGVTESDALFNADWRSGAW